MADKPIGTMFVELDLDASRYTKGQQQLLKDAQTTSLSIEQNFKNLGVKSAAEMDLMRAKIKNSFDMIANSSKATANDIIRAEEAKNAKLQALNEQQFGGQSELLGSIKKNWLALGVTAAAVAGTIHKAMEYINEGATALQIESAFKIMAESAGANSHHMIESMKAATRETIDDSAMMQKAIKLMTLEYNPEQIERFSKVVITASQIAGTTAAAAYDELADAIANRAPKALVRMGAATREQMGIVSDAITAGADAIAIYELAMANLELKQKMLQGTQNEAVIAMQQLKAQTEDMTEAIGKGLIWVLDKAYHSVEFYAAAIMGLISAYSRYRAMVYSVMGDEKQAEQNRWVADRAMETRQDLLRRWGEAVWDIAETEKRASQDEIAASKAKVDAQVSALRATTEAKKAADEAKRKAEEEARKSEQVNKKFWEDYKKEVEGAYEFERQKAEDQLKEYQKYVKDKIAVDRWYQAEKRKIDVKEYAAGDISTEDFRSVGELMGGSENYGIESDRAKSWKASEDAAQAFGKSVEEQRAAIAKLDRELSGENWWKTYIEDTEDAARANEIFKDSMNIMSQSVADAMAKMALGTGSFKDAFTSMSQAIIAGMIRMTTQQGSEALFGLLMKGGTALASAYLGGSTPTGMDTNTTFSGGQSMGYFNALVKHTGGQIDGSGPYRQMPAEVFYGAPRLHNGLAADEFPAVLQRGERVLSRRESQQQPAVININIAAPEGRVDRDSIGQMQTAAYTAMRRAWARNA